MGFVSLFWAGVVLLYPSSGLAPALVTSTVVFAAAPLALVAANRCLDPYERRVQQQYEDQARRRVERVAPLIVGITGSYGKSSTKAILAHILQYDAPTLAASGSINTLMGLTRHIREDLVYGHRYMVVEMGAFGPGSIKRLCQLTPPAAGIITAVGDMHLERFGSTDAIVKAKGELAEALPAGGLLVVNADSPGALRIAQGAGDRRVLLYGETSTENLETRLEQVQFSNKGTSFVLRTREREYRCFTPLLGRPIVLNIAGAFTLATAIGMDPDLIVAALRTLRPVSNRLEVVEENGVTWIRDAYNSNQFGFRAALEVAAALPAVRRFLVTPGVVELGAEQFPVNRQLSSEAARVCDGTFVVAGANREAFVAGHRDAGRDDRLVPVSGRAEAFERLRETVSAGDLVILENDLPDVLEHSTRVVWGRSAQARS
jgi:UDP-N-acetylmuramoyl-tripeptide--D-alanyl-D-alanine ligase